MNRRGFMAFICALGASLPFARASISPSPLDLGVMRVVRTDVGRYTVTLSRPLTRVPSPADGLVDSIEGLR